MSERSGPAMAGMAHLHPAASVLGAPSQPWRSLSAATCTIFRAAARSGSPGGCPSPPLPGAFRALHSAFSLYPARLPPGILLPTCPFLCKAALDGEQGGPSRTHAHIHTYTHAASPCSRSCERARYLLSRHAIHSPEDAEWEV